VVGLLIAALALSWSEQGEPRRLIFEAAPQAAATP
jgi:hypothetical protein